MRAACRLAAVLVIFLTIGITAPWGMRVESHAKPRGNPLDMDDAAQEPFRLPPSAFPRLPREIRDELTRRGCTIPQAGHPKLHRPPPHNVITGKFQKSGQTDWAVLCSVKQRSAVLVFWSGSAQTVDQIEDFAPDQRHLELIPRDRGSGEGNFSYARRIGPVSREQILRYDNAFGGMEPLPDPIDHKGIEDSFLGKGSVIHYHHQGRWHRLVGMD